MRWRTATASVFVAVASALTCSAAWGEPMVRASCSEGGRIVYKEDFPASDPASRRVQIAAKHPEAMCVFLDVSDNARMQPDAGVALSEDESLAAALTAIAGGRTGDRYPDSITSLMEGSGAVSKTAPTKQNKSANSSGYLNLTVGIYRKVPLEDVMAHWKAMQEGTEVLAKMTPTVNGVDGILVLSIEGVPDETAAALCEEAKRAGPGCIAAY